MTLILERKMKKKIATFLLIMFSSLCVLTGCNLFSKDTTMSLNSVVATNGEYEVTREELINAYNNGGYYYAYYYGYTQEEALNKTIDELLDQKYLLDYLDNNTEYALDSDDYDEIVSNTWEYLDSAIETYLESVKEELGQTATEEEDEEEDEEDLEYDVRESYVSKFDTDENGNIIYLSSTAKRKNKFSQTFVSEQEAKDFALTYYDNYLDHINTSDKDLKVRTWKAFVSALKSSQSSYKYSDMSDKAVVTRQIEKIFKSNLDSQKITKFQEAVKDNGMLEKTANGEYTVKDSTLAKIVEKYKEKYQSNMKLYNSFSNKDNYYALLSNTSNRDSFVYYGKQSEETMITCTHILIKLSETQEDNISNYEKKYSGEAYENAKANEESANNTYAYERDLETAEVVDSKGITVTQLYNNIEESLKNVTDFEERLSIFNDYLYKYNVDTGIINAKYDYVVGTKNSQMVTTFTDAVRDLYENGKVGDIKMVYESNDNYSGYHIVMYTGVLQNIFDNEKALDELTLQLENDLKKEIKFDTTTIKNVYNILSNVKTSLTYNETLFEYFYDAVTEDNYNTIKANVIDSQKNGSATTYNKGNYSDLF
jgi:hypothetical protein